MIIQRMVLIGLLTFAIAPRAFGQDAPPAYAQLAKAVTLKMQSAHPRDVFAGLAKETGVHVGFFPEDPWEQSRWQNPPPSSISVDIDNKPFWVAMQQICDACDLQPITMGGGGGIVLQYMNGGRRGMLGKRPVSIGPLATIALQSSQRSHTIYYDSDSAEPQKRCGLELLVYADPRLRMTKYEFQPKIDQAIDENGKSIANPSDAQNYSNEAQSPWQIQGVFSPLEYDPAASRKISTLKGSIRVTVASEIKTLEIDKLAHSQGVEKTVAGRRVVIDQITDGERNMSIKVSVHRQGLSQEYWQSQVSAIYRAIKFVNVAGKTLNANTSGGGGPNQVTYTYEVAYQNDADKPVKLVWEIPTKVEEIDLPFEFKDLALP